MKGGTFLLIGGIIAGVAVVGITVAILSKKQKKSQVETIKKQDGENKTLTPAKSVELKKIEEVKEEVFEDIQARHDVAAEYIKQATEKINEEKADNYQVDSVHSEIDNMIDEL